MDYLYHFVLELHCGFFLFRRKWNKTKIAATETTPCLLFEWCEKEIICNEWYEKFQRYLPPCHIQ